ncbi:DUF2238 domain-containing protein [Paenibacillus sp. HWE-109]|uniref:DUF2238 domain-containing protein n=1 Tax=Paenibacillus sp. HWE-109 TaxID=1306526 RepID=UPI001EDD5D9D|nr:DUF2238 domain-containing protein [Paenibacillus sp. HWE-109]UKS28257.1 DUF2238 domain-containing protein [Paenibacillus sp. HWE-109]
MTFNQLKWTSTRNPFTRNRPLQLMIFLFIIFFGLMAISPTNRPQWLVYNFLLIVVILTLIFTYKWFRFSNFSYLLMLIFFCLHTYAAHYTYEGTPLDQWLQTNFHTNRSYYDRIVHFAFGFFFYFPFIEILKLKVKLRGIWLYMMPILVILALSALFEILEMLGALVAGPEGEEKFIGMQGDIYDTQKDMAVGFLGGIISIGIPLLMNWNRDNTFAISDETH